MVADALATQIPHRVLILEDHHQTSIRLSEAVKACDLLSICGTAYMLDDGLKKLFELRPRVVLTDLGLPDGSGIEMIKAVMATDWACDALVISVFGDERRVISAISAGAKGYILKNSGTETIADDVLSVIEGGSPISPQIARYLLSMVADQQAPLMAKEKNISLTKREHEILTIVARGYTRAEIGQQLNISAGTVGNHINNIYKKLEVGSNTQAVSRATKMGII